MLKNVKRRTIFLETWEVYEAQMSVSKNKASFEQTQATPLIYIWHYAMAKLSCYDTNQMTLETWNICYLALLEECLLVSSLEAKTSPTQALII